MYLVRIYFDLINLLFITHFAFNRSHRAFHFEYGTLFLIVILYNRVHVATHSNGFVSKPTPIFPKSARTLHTNIVLILSNFN